MVLCYVMYGSCMNVGHDTDTSTSVDVEHMDSLVRTTSQSYVCTHNQHNSMLQFRLSLYFVVFLMGECPEGVSGRK